MYPSYAEWRERQRESIDLYRARAPVDVIAWWLDVTASTVRLYLRRAHVRRGRVPAIQTTKRPAYWELHTHSGAIEVVCGRKFCSYCGRWRHLVDFAPAGDKPHTRCRTCGRIANRYYQANLSPSQLDRRRERGRMAQADKRRRNGVRPQANRVTVIDHIERVYLPSAPLVPMLSDLGDSNRKTLARRADVSERDLRRYASLESEHIRLDIADRLVMALGASLWEVWGDIPLSHQIRYLDREVI